MLFQVLTGDVVVSFFLSFVFAFDDVSQVGRYPVRLPSDMQKASSSFFILAVLLI